MATTPLMNNYARLSVAFERGEGSWLYDQQGNKFLDALSGIAVCGLGHAHPKVTQAITEQASRLIHTSNLYIVPLQQQLADRLTALSGMDNAFFCNSGAEANEAAIKLARLHGHQRGIDNPAIIGDKTANVPARIKMTPLMTASFAFSLIPAIRLDAVASVGSFIAKPHDV